MQTAELKPKTAERGPKNTDLKPETAKVMPKIATRKRQMQARTPMDLSQKSEKLWTSCTFAKNSILPLLEISARYVARKI